jgi:hypothetical protein
MTQKPHATSYSYSRSLDGIDRLFMLMWWQIKKFVEKDADERVVADEKLEEEKVAARETVHEVERV